MTFNKKILLTIILASISSQVSAVPNAGYFINDINNASESFSDHMKQSLKITDDVGIPIKDNTHFDVKEIIFSGNTIFDTKTLEKLMSELIGQSLTLTQLSEATDKITEFYHANGYILARVIIPAQTIHDGVVQLQILEVKYGAVTLHNKSGVNNSLFTDSIDELHSSDFVEKKALMEALLRISDIPGISTAATIKRGEKFGTSDLNIEVIDSSAFNGIVTADNYGNLYTGVSRLSSTIQINNLLGHGDIMSISALTSGNGMSYGSANYETMLTGYGLRFGGSLSSLEYALGGSLKPINAHGTAKTINTWLKNTLMRTESANVYGQLQFSSMKLADHIDSTTVQTDRHIEQVSLKLNGDMEDSFLSTSKNKWDLALVIGRVGFDNKLALLIDKVSAKTNGQFAKINADFSREQKLSDNNSLYFHATGQWTNNSLDPVQKMSTGGIYSVRAYAMGVMSGDSGYSGTIEFKSNFGTVLNGDLQGILFIDSQHIIVNRNPWLMSANDVNLNGGGFGANWTSKNGWNVKAFVASKLGATPKLVTESSSSRAWIEVNNRF